MRGAAATRPDAARPHTSALQACNRPELHAQSARMSEAPTAAPAIRRRRWPRALLALGLGGLGALLLGELACRLLYGAPLSERTPLMEVLPHAARGYTMVPGTRHYTYEHEVRVNALGLRGAEAPEGPDGPRVLCVGDSFVYGQGVAEADTIPGQLEAALARRRAAGAPRAHVLNAGHRAYATEQELALIAELAPRVAPEVVVLVWFPNDLEEVDPAALAERVAAGQPFCFDVGGPFDGERAASWERTQLLRSSALVMKLHDAWQDAHYRAATPAALEAGYARLARSLATLAALAQQHDFAVLVAVLPPSSLVAVDEERGSAAPRVLSLAAVAGLAGLDLLPALRAQRRADGRLHVLPYDGHYDGRAYAAVGEELARELEQRFARRLGG